MAQSSSKSVIVVGGGIVGLCIATAAQARGHTVTLIARDAPDATASGVAAGMIAPALEAMNDPDPKTSFERLTAAQSAWFDLFDLWPAEAWRLLSEAYGRGDMLWCAEKPVTEGALTKLTLTGAQVEWLDAEAVVAAGFSPGTHALARIDGDWLVEAAMLLPALWMGLDHACIAEVAEVGRSHVRLATGETLAADEVIIAAGFDSQSLAGDVPALARLAPIKGHLLDVGGIERYGVMRSVEGYYAGYGGRGKFGASMQEGKSDLAIEPDIVAELKDRARTLDLETGDAIPRTGVRASSPDGWPMIGRDAASGVLVATAMRRNGYVFAPLAARMMLDFIDGREPVEAALYDANRF